MDIKKFKALFPLSGEITKDIIKQADLRNPYDCIGVRTLKAALGNNLPESKISWGSTGGALMSKERIFFTTKESVNMMRVKRPRKVTFIIRETLHKETP